MSLRRNSIYTMMAVALILTSCSRQIVYSHYESIDTEGWNRNDCKDFRVTVREKDTYTEMIGLRTTMYYPYANLSVIVSQQTQRSGIQHTDTLHIRLMDEEGNKVGQGTNYQQMEIPVRTIELEDEDTLLVSIRHYMKREVLPGITDVGVSLEIED